MKDSIMRCNVLLFLSNFLVAVFIVPYTAPVFSSFDDIENIKPLLHENHDLSMTYLPFIKKSEENFMGDSKRNDDKQFEILQELYADIKEAYDTACSSKLLPLCEIFEKLDYQEEEWQGMARKLGAKKWPLQKTWKQTVGSYLFFPEAHLYSYLQSSYTSHLLDRHDILRGLVFASAFHHPLALFHLGNTLIKINWDKQNLSDTKEEDVIEFSRKLLKRSYQDLTQCLDDPNVFYSVCYGSYNDPYNQHPYLSIKELFPSVISTDLKIQMIILQLKRQRPRIFAPPRVDDYLIIARQGFLPAYEPASYLAHKQKNDVLAHDILKEAANAGYPLAYVRLAELDIVEKDLYLEKGIQANIPSAFILKALLLVGDIRKDKIKKKKLLSVPHKIQEEAASLFQRAGELHDPKGFEYLGKMKLKLSKSYEFPPDQNRLKQEAIDAFTQGCKLGSPECYTQLYCISEKDYINVSRITEGDPRGDLWTYFQSVLNAKGHFNF